MTESKLGLSFWVMVITIAGASAPTADSAGIKGGYWPSWLADTNPPSTIPISLFTHLFYAFVVPNPSTYKLSITHQDTQLMRNFTTTLHSKTRKVKIMLSIGGGGSNSTTFSTMAGNSKFRADFITSTIEVGRNYGFDGFDLDWEFPANPQDMLNLAQLFKEWKSAAEKESKTSGKPRLLLSAAVYFSSTFFLANVPRTYPGKSINKYVDFVSPMCFDYHGSWDTSVTGQHALLYDKNSNISTSYGISSWMDNKVRPEKLVMGLPVYGRSWKLKDSKVNGIRAPAVGTGPGNEGVIVYHEILDFNSEKGATVVYDAETVSMYSYSGTDWIGYDGPKSIKKKIEFAKAHGLGGYFFWALGYDKNWILAQTASSTWDRRK